MKKFSPLLLILVILLAACSALPEAPAVALASDKPEQPFRSGLEIAKPTYTPLPTAIFTTTPLPPTAIPTSIPTETPASSVFAEDAFVVVENLPAPASAGYDNTTPYDSQSSYSGSKYILVDISEQHMYVYEADELVYSFIASTGMENSTRVGSFSVLNKIPNAYGATWNIWMPNWLGIYWSGSLQNGIHALPILPNGATLWAGFLGTPISYGCVVLDTYDAQILYDWADIGTPVEIRW
ncbi:MAG: L,D-transpeptidase family protein [Anaerolineales bacterium]